ncbi:MAG: alpha/beta hydrolase [Ruminiclostridium sp.]|nr:alpha/beta hydrolase [Ruminiclostridium sp.]
MKTEIQTVTANGAEMDYISFGSGSRNMVIIPGLSLMSVCESGDAVANAYKMFAAEYTVYLFDRRKNLPPVYGIPDMARDTAAAFDALGIRDAYVFGTSQGGMIAQVIAAERPELVKALVIGSSASRVSDERKAEMSVWVDAAKKGDAAAVVSGFAGAVYSEAFYEKNRGAFGVLAKMLTAEQLGRFVILAESIGTFDVYDMLPDIKCPVLVIGAGNDRVLGAEASRETAEKLGCELYIYENGSHAAYDEEPDYKDRIYGFFEKCRKNC